MRYRTARRLTRRIAPLLAVSFISSQILAPGVRVAAASEAGGGGYTRHLATAEMEAIFGAQGQGGPDHVLSLTPDGGTVYPWEGQSGGTNTGNGNKLTRIPLVGWTAKGGMAVEFSLYHNSEGNHNSELGPKWTHSFDQYLVLDGSGNVTVHWGDDLAYTFTKNIDGSYTAPTGIHDALVANGSPITSYDLTTKEQIKIRFTNPNATGWHSATIKDLRNNTITINRNTDNFVTSVVDPTNRTLTLSYTSGKITGVSDPLSRSWTLSYTLGKLTQVTLPSVGGNSYNIQFGYDANNCITSYTDRRGKAWEFSYNADGSLAWEEDPYDNRTTFTYADGQTTITDPNNRTVKHNYASGRLSSVEDPLTYSESYLYDASNNRYQTTDRRGKIWEYTFDSRGNVLTQEDPLGHITTFTYNSFNQPLTITCDDGHQTVNTYNGTGSLTQTQQKDAQANVISTWTYSPNTDGTLANKTDSNSRTTSYGYNSNGHLTSVTTPNSRVTSWTVNGLGVTSSRTDALNRTTNYTLDNWGRVTATDYPSGTDHSFTFDAESNLTAWTDSTGSWTRSYDDAGRILTEKLGGVTQVAYTWDATGKKGLLSSITDESARTVTYSYTDRNQLSSVVDSAGTASYSYDANGAETQVTLQNTAYSVKAYDDAGRLTSVTNKNSGGTTLSSFTYAYSDDDLRTTCTELNGDVVSYGYDGAHRLTSESRTGANAYTRSYTLDGVGNRTSQVVGGVTTNFTLNNDYELTATSGGFSNSYSYNANGEQTGRTLSGTAYTLAYDFDGQLTSITQGGNTTSFTYDAGGRRITRTAGGTTTRYIPGPGGILLEKVGTNYTGVYTHGNAQVRKDSEYPLYDGIGSERTVTVANQSVSGAITFDGFGQTIVTTGSSSNPYMFKGAWGYRSDGDAGLSHAGARYYDAQVGRFITRDTYLDQHPYLYCEHDPINFADPDGHVPVLLIAIGGRILLPVVVRGISYIGAAAVGAGARMQLHHIVPKYLGGDPNGMTVRIPKAYHQQITNAFRELWPYRRPGQTDWRPPSPAQLAEIMKKVYDQFPLPRPGN